MQSIARREALCQRILMHISAVFIVAAMATFAADRSALSAESSDCILDHCADKAAPKAASDANKPAPDAKADDAAETPAAANGGFARPQPRGASRPGDFDFYVLSLSWSPGFCATSNGRTYAQCDVGSNKGFVVHGLWPQYEHGFPQDCESSARSPSRIALDTVEGVYPDQGLARYEWRKHGTCSGKSPTDYFADVRRARDAVTVPPPFQSAKDQQNWTPIDIERAFIAANARLRPGMLAVGCRSGTLEEVRFCFSKDLREFRICPEVARQTCRTSTVSVPPMR
jgi:ribonuclease T2